MRHCETSSKDAITDPIMFLRFHSSSMPSLSISQRQPISPTLWSTDVSTYHNSAHSRTSLLLRTGFDPKSEDPSFETGLGMVPMER